jgi:hypothetical protein
MEVFDLRKPNDASVKEKYQVQISKNLQFYKTWMIMWTSAGLGK